NACLERRLAQVGQLVGLFAHADGPLVDRATRAVHVVGDLASCAAPSAEPAPRDADRAAVAAIRAQLDQGDVLERAGRASAAHALAATAVAAAERTTHAPTQARALFLLAHTADAMGDGRAAEAALDRALDAAARSADPQLLADAWVRMFGVVGAVQDRFDEAARLYRVAQLSVTAAGDPPELRVRLLRDLGSMQLEKGELAAARTTFRDLLTREESRPQARKDELATALNNLGAVEVELGDFAAAQADLGRAAALIEAELGPAHPSLSFPLVNLGLVLQDQERFAESIPYLERAYRIDRAALGDDSPELAGTESAYAAALVAVDRLDEARALAEHSVAVRERLLGPDHPDTSWSLATLANIDARQHRLAQARGGYQRVVAIRTKALGADHAETAAAQAQLADFECVHGDPAVGARLAVAAVDATIAAFGADHPRTQSMVVDAARCQRDTARAPWPERLRRAVAILDENHAGAASRAAVRVELARAIVARDLAGARALAIEASAIAGDAAPEARATATAWLAAHPAR
ncbi:MAG: tetratricopeptide repeat protein, partial [Deltaproteobacteria bacterium]|nr:tetratricopeptide repeat protein [Deltaproteobacteria bacterium]